MYTENDFRLYHHGVLGQKWGKRNGPPYPLGQGSHSRSEKAAGWKKSLGGGRNESEYRVHGKKVNSSRRSIKKQGMSDTAAGALSLATLGLISVSPVIYIAGKDAVVKHKDKKAATKRLDKWLEENKDEVKIDEATGFRLKKDKNTSVEDDLKAINPVRKMDDLSTNNNCAMCSMALELRRRGFDVVANVSPKPLEGLKMLEKNFKEVRINKIDPAGMLDKKSKDSKGSRFEVDGTAWTKAETAYAYSKARAGEFTEMADSVLKSMREEKNTRGIMTLAWGAGGGHMVCYEVSNTGQVNILDAQTGKKLSTEETRAALSSSVLTTYTRTDNLEINPKAIRKAVR